MSSPIDLNMEGTKQSPEKEVQRLLADAQDIHCLDHTVENFVQQNQQMFLQVFDRQCQSLRRRSQDLSDAHVTVYDRVLLALTQNGTDLQNSAAITWYCAWYLGHCPVENMLFNAASLYQSIRLSENFAKAKSSGPFIHKEPASPTPTERGKPPDYQERAFEHLIDVYTKAREEYLACAEDKSQKTLDAARFLRDTAENGVHFLKKQPPYDERVMAELQKTYDMAVHQVEALNGGRKRKFDHEAHVPRKARSQTIQRYPGEYDGHPVQDLPRASRIEWDRPAEHYLVSHLPRGSVRPPGQPFYWRENTRLVDSYQPRRR